MENQPLNLNESSIPFDNTSVLNDTTILNLNHDLSQIKYTDFQIPDDILDEFSIQILKDIANNSFEDKNTFEGVEYKKEMLNLFKMLLDKNPKMKKIKLISANLGKETKDGPQINYKKYYFLSYTIFYSVTIIERYLRIGVEILFELYLSYRSGNILITKLKPKIAYKNKDKCQGWLKLYKEEEDFPEELRLLIYNNELGKNGLKYCSCENCLYFNKIKDNMKNDDINKDILFPVESYEKLRILLNNKFNLGKNLELTQPCRFRSKINKANPLELITCSFCNSESLDSQVLVKIFFHKKIDSDHNCYFYFCPQCFDEITDNIPCPNCNKFQVNFKNIKTLEYPIFSQNN